MRLDAAGEAQSIQSQLSEWRRDFHAHPELGFQERRSAQRISRVLEVLGYSVRTGVATTGVVGLLRGPSPGPVVMLRFDMDALPIQERTDLEFASLSPGVMHACGHDAHMAIGLGVATLVARHRAEMAGTVKIVFQPGEEGMNGAEVMVKEGVLKDPRPDVFLSGHVWNDLMAGTVDVLAGPVMAAAERWDCTVRGRGGHGAMPHQTIDPIVAASHVVAALQSVVSRNVEPLGTAVVTVGTVRGGDAFNIVPSQVELSGTIRTFDPAVRSLVTDRVREICTGVSDAFGASADVRLSGLSPAVVNNAEVAAVVRKSAEAILGPRNVLSGVRTTGSEDASLRRGVRMLPSS
jgi:amidohydrolase